MLALIAHISSIQQHEDKMSENDLGEPNVARYEFDRFFKIAFGFREDKAYTIDGITFDFACDLDRAIWEPLHPLGLHDVNAIKHGPEIVFPWTSDQIIEFIAQEAEPVRAEHGDTISINWIENKSFSSVFGSLDPAEDREVRLAHLFIKRHNKDGLEECIAPRRPLILVTNRSTAQLISLGDHLKAYNGLLRKLASAFNVEDIEESIEGPISTWPKPNPNIPKSYIFALIALSEAKHKFDEDALVSFGYMMARGEAEDHLLHLAKRGLAAESAQQKAVLARKAISRESTELLRRTAKQVISDNPSISLSRCARTVADILSEQEVGWSKDPKWIERHIKELFERRPNGREYMPRRA